MAQDAEFFSEAQTSNSRTFTRSHSFQIRQVCNHTPCTEIQDGLPGYLGRLQIWPPALQLIIIATRQLGACILQSGGSASPCSATRGH